MRTDSRYTIYSSSGPYKWLGDRVWSKETLIRWCEHCDRWRHETTRKGLFWVWDTPIMSSQDLQSPKLCNRARPKVKAFRCSAHQSNTTRDPTSDMTNKWFVWFAPKWRDFLMTSHIYVFFFIFHHVVWKWRRSCCSTFGKLFKS